LPGRLYTISAMKNILLSQRNIQMLVILIALISIVFIVWQYEQSVSNQQSLIVSLQEQLGSQQLINRSLGENLALAEKQRLMTESDLQDLINKDWEMRFEQSKQENQSLKKEIAELLYHHGIEITRLERARNFLSTELGLLVESQNKFSEIRRELEQNTAVLESEIEQYKKAVASLETENKQNKKLIADLQKPVESKKQPVVISETSATQTTADGEDKAGNYRHVRLQSLINAMRNQDSVARKNILVSVVPTIPNGISDSEFLSLVSGMESKDLLEAIRLTNKYINRPLDGQTISALIETMDVQDAEAANVIFNTKE